MKYAFMTFSCPDLSLDQVLALAKRYGYDGIEPRLVSNHAHGIEWDTTPAQRKDTRKRVKDSGIALACLATSSTFADPAQAENSVHDTRKAIDLAADLGCLALRVFGGSLPKDVDRKKAIDSLVRSLSALADQARNAAVTVCVETHDDWCDPKHLATVMRQVNHPAIAVNWDIMHPVRRAGVTIEDSFAVLRPWIRHIHFHDGVTEPGDKLVLQPIGRGMIDHRAAVRLLLAADYNGYLSGEWIDWEP
ncbi:MAG: sugar phosphate isomerase/epimerase family protein, partial [Planctomycetota bacterium]